MYFVIVISNINNSVMIIYFVLAYLLLSFIVTTFAIERRISLGSAFTVSFFLTPVLGLLAILKSDKKVKITHYYTKYYCPSCHSEFTSGGDYCPVCLKKGIKIKPEKIKLAG